MESTTITIDGSQGEGGGQILRSSLTLSLVTGRPLVLEKIRAGRPKPGLQRQHLASVMAAAKVGRAEVEGAVLGSKRISFIPGAVQPGCYNFRIGSAGSTTLVAQTVVPALLIGDTDSHVTVEGGTHNPMAPTAEFLEKTYLPTLNRLGPNVSAEVVRAGFYPAGGGELKVRIKPVRQLGWIKLIDRGPFREARVRVLLSKLPMHIAEREVKTIRSKFPLPLANIVIDEVRPAMGPGNALMVELEYERVTEVFTEIGSLGVRAESVALAAWKRISRYLQSDAPVGPHLADQLMLPLGIAAHHGTGGGEFRTIDLSQHSLTHIDILQRVLDIAIHIDRRGRDNTLVSIAPN
jgi:RNA 3'-terminal phosphate cyclase (ATP)